MLSRLADFYETVASNLRLQIDPTLRYTVRDWCLRELEPWIQDGQIPVEQSRLATLNANHPWIFLFNISQSGVEVVSKPTEIDTGGEPAYRRVAYYQDFLARVARRNTLAKPMTLALDLNDEPFSGGDVPLFSFQKIRGSTNILIPDIEFLLKTHNSLPSWLNFDRTPWSRKHNTAVFAGSTTGGRITADVVRTLSLPRLRAGMFFRDKPEVVFRLPFLVECDTPQTETMLRNLGFGVEPLPWRLQFKHRFVISMDGNGATCSRVALTLRSQSVLLKYDSNRDLYYFHGLQPWTHYIPIKSDAEVMEVLACAKHSPERFRSVSRVSQSFATRFLTRRMVDYYMQTLLHLYVKMAVAV